MVRSLLHRRSLWLSLLVFASGVVLMSAPAAEPLASDAPGSFVCPVPDPTAHRLRYRVTGRARPLLFWTGRRDVGEARIDRSEGDAGTRHYSLLIGTDPDRAPFGMNRWGYVAETTCAAGADLLGVMTQSDEATIDEAEASLATGPGAGYAYRAVRARASGTRVESEVLRIVVDEALTYLDLDALVARLPPPETHRDTSIADGAAPGFLVAVADLVGITSTDGENSWERHQARDYVYAGNRYRLSLDSEVRHDVDIGDHVHDEVIAGRFEIRNLATRKVTKFDMTWTTAGPVAVPLRVVYRPRWWLELELVLDDAERAPWTR